MSRPLTMDQAASELGVSRRWFTDFLRSAPKCWLEAGHKKLFDEVAMNRLKAAVALAQTGRPRIIYLVGFDDYVKIGVTDNFKHRLSQLQTGSPKKLSVYLTYRCDALEEMKLHVFFAEHRLEGEWFVFCEPIRQFIAEIKRDIELRQEFLEIRRRQMEFLDSGVRP